MARLDGKVAVITGAGQGIGAAIAVSCHDAGASVVLADISGKQEAVACGLGERALAVPTDVTRFADVEAAVRAGVETFGGLHALVSCAGIEGRVGPISTCSEEDFDAVMAVDLKGVFFGMKAAFAAMANSGGGSIVNVASTAALVAYPMVGPYCAAKAGVVQLTKVGALEGAPKGIRVNAICPGTVDTEMTRRFDRTAMSQLVAATPMARAGRPEEIAALAVFLASDESSYVTGAAIPVDGGYVVP